MTELVDVNIKNIKFKKSCEKIKEHKTNYIISHNGKKPIVNIEKAYIPFGCEIYEKRQILNIDIDPKKHYDVYAAINGFENQLANIENYTDKDVIKNIENKGYYKNIRESKMGYIIRSHLFYEPKVFCNINGFTSTMTLNDIKNTVANVELEFGTLWITDNNYGIIWTIKKIEVLYNKKN